MHIESMTGMRRTFVKSFSLPFIEHPEAKPEYCRVSMSRRSWRGETVSDGEMWKTVEAPRYTAEWVKVL